MLWSTLFCEAIDPDTPVLVHRIGEFVYSCMLPDLGITLEHRPSPLLAAWLTTKQKDFDCGNMQSWIYRPRALTVVADALAHWDRLTVDHKIWMYETFLVNLDIAREAASFYFDTQERVAAELVAKRKT